MKFTTLLASAAMVLGLGGAALADGHEKTKVGFVYVGPIGDGGWTYEHDKGRLAVEAEFGDKVETVYVENVAEGPDSERVMTEEQVRQLERQNIVRALNVAGGRVSGPGGAAAMLGVRPSTLSSRIKKMGIRRVAQ